LSPSNAVKKAERGVKIKGRELTARPEVREFLERIVNPFVRDSQLCIIGTASRIAAISDERAAELVSFAPKFCGVCCGARHGQTQDGAPCIIKITGAGANRAKVIIGQRFMLKRVKNIVKAVELWRRKIVLVPAFAVFLSDDNGACYEERADQR
jgi:hypothetical protein